MTDHQAPMNRETVIREPAMPGRIWYGVAGAVGISGVVAFSVLLLSSLSGMGDDLQQMKAPGKAEFTFREPGSYTVFHEHESVFEGAYFSSPDAVSGLKIGVKPSAGGKALAVNAAGVNASYELSGRSGVAIFEFEITEPGAYRINARYGDGRSKPVVILAIGHDFMGGLFTLILSGLGLLFGGLGGAGVIAVFTYLKRDRALSAQKGST